MNESAWLIDSRIWAPVHPIVIQSTLDYSLFPNGSATPSSAAYPPSGLFLRRERGLDSVLVNLWERVQLSRRSSYAGRRLEELFIDCKRNDRFLTSTRRAVRPNTELIMLDLLHKPVRKLQRQPAERNCHRPGIHPKSWQLHDKTDLRVPAHRLHRSSAGPKGDLYDNSSLQREHVSVILRFNDPGANRI